MKRVGMIGALSSKILVLSYLLCTLISMFNYPLAYSPIKNWLSDLGNSVFNPTGAIFYNTGIVLTAVWLVIFFLGLSTLKINDNKIQYGMLILTQSFGIFGSMSMALSAFFTIANPGPHSLLSAMLYIGLGTAFGFSVAALRYHPKVPKWLLALGVLTTLFDLLASLFFNSVPVFEWITVSLFLVYVASLGGSTRSLANRSSGRQLMAKKA